jgi:hypothetical protein
MEIKLDVTSEDLEMDYPRILNNILKYLPEDYPKRDEVTSLKSLLEHIDMAFLKASKNVSRMRVALEKYSPEQIQALVKAIQE